MCQKCMKRFYEREGGVEKLRRHNLWCEGDEWYQSQLNKKCEWLEEGEDKEELGKRDGKRTQDIQTSSSRDSSNASSAFSSSVAAASVASFGC